MRSGDSPFSRTCPRCVAQADREDQCDRFLSRSPIHRESTRGVTNTLCVGCPCDEPRTSSSPELVDRDAMPQRCASIPSIPSLTAWAVTLVCLSSITCVADTEGLDTGEPTDCALDATCPEDGKECSSEEDCIATPDAVRICNQYGAAHAAGSCIDGKCVSECAPARTCTADESIACLTCESDAEGTQSVCRAPPQCSLRNVQSPRVEAATCANFPGRNYAIVDSMVTFIRDGDGCRFAGYVAAGVDDFGNLSQLSDESFVASPSPGIRRNLRGELASDRCTPHRALLPGLHARFQLLVGH